MFFFFFQAEDGIRDYKVTEVQTCALPISFALVIDAKSPWTFQHSRGVAATGVAIAEVMGYPREQIREIRRAALLHDIGRSEERRVGKECRSEWGREQSKK